MSGVLGLKIVANWVITCLFIVFIISQFLPIQLFDYIFAILTVIIVGISLIYSKGLSKFFGIAMVTIGSVILLYQKAGFDIWMTGVIKNLPLVCLILIVPILGIPIGFGNY